MSFVSSPFFSSVEISQLSKFMTLSSCFNFMLSCYVLLWNIFYFVFCHSSFYGLKGLSVFFLHCTYFSMLTLCGGGVEEKTSLTLFYEPFPRISWFHPGTFIVLNLNLWFELLILNPLYICAASVHISFCLSTGLWEKLFMIFS